VGGKKTSPDQNQRKGGAKQGGGLVNRQKKRTMRQEPKGARKWVYRVEEKKILPVRKKWGRKRGKKKRPGREGRKQVYENSRSNIVGRPSGGGKERSAKKLEVPEDGGLVSKPESLGEK